MSAVRDQGTICCRQLHISQDAIKVMCSATNVTKHVSIGSSSGCALKERCSSLYQTDVRRLQTGGYFSEEELKTEGEWMGKICLSDT